MTTDTIAAIATAPGRGGIGIVRVSGPKVPAIAEAVLGRQPRPRHACYGVFRDADGGTLDDGIAVYSPAPASYTGEHVLELQGHGAPVLLDALLARVCALGARPAGPGEFTRRAFDNNRLDLTQAEAVADLIDADSLAAARAAQRSLSGEFSRHIDAVTGTLTELRTWMEAAIDFVDEDIDVLADGDVANRLGSVIDGLHGLRAGAQRGRALTEGLRIAIVGAPNVGKSSLLNRLSGHDTAIVTDIAGTTRDVLRERIVLDGLPVVILDTAGLRDTDDPVESAGVARAWATLDEADVVLHVHDATDATAEDAELAKRMPQTATRLVVWNKCDSTGQPAGLHDGELYLSARTGDGVDALIAAIRSQAGLSETSAGQFSARRRHLVALDAAIAVLEHARDGLAVGQPPELLAADLAEAARELGSINGAVTSEDLLGRIFSAFCIGK